MLRRRRTKHLKHTGLKAANKSIVLETIADNIASAKDDLVETAMKETHLPRPRLEGELVRTIAQLRMFAALLTDGSWVNAIIDTAIPDRKPFPRPDIRQMQMPLGPVAVFGASNFLCFFGSGGDTASALAAGCPVVCKAHPGHPETSDKVATIIYASVPICGLPDGVFSIIHTTDNHASIELVTNPHIKAVGFTGSLNAGKAILMQLFEGQNQFLFTQRWAVLTPCLFCLVLLKNNLLNLLRNSPHQTF